MKLFSRCDALICADCLTFFGPWIVIIFYFLPFIVGVMDARGWTVMKEPCTSEVAKIEYVLFGYRAGCWAGKP